ncbi:unnamed protein product [Victoria cruziana]
MASRAFFLVLLLSFLLREPSSASSSAIISRFQEYLRINTSQPAPNYADATAFLLSQADSISLESQTLELSPGKPLVLLRWPGSSPRLPAILLNSHTDVVPSEPQKWRHHPFSAALDAAGDIYARGSQDMKCVGMQYLEAIRRLKASGFRPLRSVYLSFVPDEEVGGHDGVELFVESEVYRSMNVGIVLDEGLASETDEFRVFYGERCPWWLAIKAVGPPGHGSKLYDGSAMENLLKSLESISRFRESQFQLIKAGFRALGEVVSINPVFLKAGTPTPTFKQKVPVYDEFGNPAITKTDCSNPWWMLLERAVKKAGGKLRKPEIFPAATDARYFRQKGLPAIGFSPMANTPILLHDHNEFLNQEVYLKGIQIYEAIIEAYASYEEPISLDESLAEL